MKKNLLISVSMLLSVIFILSGCSWFSTKEGNSDVDACVYYIEGNGTTLVEMDVSLPDGSHKEKVEYLINQLLNPPEGKQSPLCKGTKVISVRIEDEIVTVDFTKEFSNQEDTRYTLAPAALAKTLCSLEFISGVDIRVEGSAALGVDGTPIGIIMESDVLDISLTTQPTKKTVVLYFADGMGEGLSVERRDVEVAASSTVEKVVVEELIKGPKNSDNISTIPAETKILSVETKNRVCFVNLSKEFEDRYQGGTAGEVLTIYSIVNSLTELDTVGTVQFLIEGEKRDVFVHMAINEPIARDKSIVVE